MNPTISPPEFASQHGGRWESGRLEELFEIQARCRPEGIAVNCGQESMTYRDLDLRATGLALRLQQIGIQPEQLVGLCMERSNSLAVAVLGILKAGGAYVPMEVAYPDERLEFIIQDAQVTVLITDSALESRLRKVAPTCQIICLDTMALPKEQPILQPLEHRPEHLAYVIYTSGSTGQPKGVLITHKNVIRLFSATWQWFRFGPTDVWTLFHSIAFDFSVWELWGALLFGGRLVVVPRRVSRSPDLFHSLLIDERVTILNQTPSAFKQLITADEGSPSRDKLALRLVVFGGEALEMKSLKPWFDRHGDSAPRLVNMYGITETTVHVTYRPLTRADIDKPSLIGIPIPDLEFHLLDEQMRPVPRGELGEIFVGGGGVARGYLNRPDLTERRFVLNPFSSKPEARLYRSGDLARQHGDHDYEYCGRIDLQVKIRGHRVELGEIESFLLDHPQIRECAVAVKGGDRLVGYIVTRNGEIPGASVLRAHLAQRLPDYMIPGAFVMLEKLPLNHNGKLDREALPEPAPHRPTLAQAYVAPRHALERELTALCARILKLDQVGIHDPFFELGGTSLLAAEFIQQCHAILGEFIYVVTLFDHPTMAQFAEFLQKEYPEAVAKVFPAITATSRKQSAGTITENDLVSLRAAIPFRPAVHSTPNSVKNSRAIFVLGAPRSGTTLFRVMLAGHPQLFSAAELLLLGFDTMLERSDAFTGKFSLWKEGLIRAVMEIQRCSVETARAVLADFEQADLSTKEVFRVIQQWLGPRILVEKSPSYALDPQILLKAEQDFADPFYIHLVRHPYAMVKSFEKNHVEQVLYLKENTFSGRELGELIWNETNLNALQFLETISSSRQFRIRFEDLTRNPQNTMEALCEAIGIPFHPDILLPYKDKERKMVDGIHAVSTPMGDTKFQDHGRIDPSVADTWRDVDQDNFLSNITWTLADRLGYETPQSRMQASRDSVRNNRSGRLKDQSLRRATVRSVKNI